MKRVLADDNNQMMMMMDTSTSTSTTSTAAGDHDDDPRDSFYSYGDTSEFADILDNDRSVVSINLSSSSTSNDDPAGTMTQTDNSANVDDDDYAKYGYGGSPNKVSDSESMQENDDDPYGYNDYGYEEPDGCREPPCHRTATPRRSSLKHDTSRRRSSIKARGEIEVTVPTGRKVTRRVSIGYSEELVQVKQVPPVSELTDEPHRLWFQDEEYSHMHQTIWNIVDEVKRGNKHLDTRGLEDYVMDESDGQESKERRLDAWYSVLLEQYLQREKGTYNDDDICRGYMVSSWQCQKLAAERASQDAEDIKRYTSDMRRAMRRCSM